MIQFLLFLIFFLCKLNFQFALVLVGTFSLILSIFFLLFEINFHVLFICLIIRLESSDLNHQTLMRISDFERCSHLGQNLIWCFQFAADKKLVRKFSFSSIPPFFLFMNRVCSTDYPESGVQTLNFRLGSKKNLNHFKFAN